MTDTIAASDRLETPGDPVVSARSWYSRGLGRARTLAEPLSPRGEGGAWASTRLSDERVLVVCRVLGLREEHVVGGVLGLLVRAEPPVEVRHVRAEGLGEGVGPQHLLLHRVRVHYRLAGEGVAKSGVGPVPILCS